MSLTDIVPSSSSVSKNLAPRASPYLIWLACFTAAGYSSTSKRPAARISAASRISADRSDS